MTTIAEHKQFSDFANHICRIIEHNCKKLYVQHDKKLTTSYLGSRGGWLKESLYYAFNNKKHKYPINLNLIPDSILPTWDGTHFGQDYSFVYILTNFGKPIYVGETTCLTRRIGEHSHKNFDKVRIIRFTKGSHPTDWEYSFQRLLFG